MMSRFLISVFFLLLATWVSAGQVSAQAIGSHLGEGDITWQATIMERVIKSNGAKEGTPVTIQVSNNTSTDDIYKLSQAASGLLPIWRIDLAEKCKTVVDATRVIGDIRRIGGGDSVIVFGNEINNKEVECSNYANYLSSYQGLRALGAGPAALDYYNSVFPAQNFLSDGGEALYQGAGNYFANAYGCIGDNVDSCQPLSTSTHQIGYSKVAGRGPLYLTEFSLSPEGQKSDAPDADLLKVIEFIEGRAAETGARAITPLIRNVCTDQKADGEWLIYLSKTATGASESQIFTRAGKEIDPATCSASGSTDYYLYPIPGIIEKDKNLLIESLSRQGYEARCTSPIIMVNSFVNSISDYLYDQVNEQTEYVSNEFDMVIDLGKAQVPLWRQEGFTSLSVINSLESLFGYRDATEIAGGNVHKTLSDAPIYRLTNPTQQCQLQISMLETVERMCSLLQDPSDCALDIPIEHTAHTARSLLAEIRNEVGDQNLSGQCDKLLNLERDDPIRVGLNYTPLFLPNAYRLGFLVMSAELKGDGAQWGSGSGFKFLRVFGPYGSHQPKNEVRVFAFKIPDFGTNKDPDSDIYYQDALELTAQSLMMPEQIDEVARGYEEIRNYEKFDNRINCMTPEESEYCRDSTLVQGLVDFVNLKLQDPHEHCDLLPEDLPYERVTQIFAGADLPESSGREHAGPPEGDLVKSLEEQSISQGTPEERGGINWPFRFLSIGDAKTGGGGAPTQDGWENMMKIRSYMILPMGYKLEQIENTLMGSFFMPSEIEAMNKAFADPKNTDFVNYLQLTNPGFEVLNNPGRTVQAGVLRQIPGNDIPSGCRPLGDDREGDIWAFCSETIRNTIESDLSDNNPRMPGGRLATIVRKMQLSLNQYVNPVWDYLTKCTSLEDMLLGRCGAATQVPSGIRGPGTVPPPGTCGAGQISAEEMDPPYSRPSILDPSSPSSLPGQSLGQDNPRAGAGMYYGRGIMNQVLRNRKAWEQIGQDQIVSCEVSDLNNNPNPGGHVGCVALYRSGDIGREVWIKPHDKAVVEGPFLVIDVAAKKDVPCLIERNWVVDIDWSTAARWGMVGVGPKDVEIFPSRPSGIISPR